MDDIVVNRNDQIETRTSQHVQIVFNWVLIVQIVFISLYSLLI